MLSILVWRGNGDICFLLVSTNTHSSYSKSCKMNTLVLLWSNEWMRKGQIVAFSIINHDNSQSGEGEQLHAF